MKAEEIKKDEADQKSVRMDLMAKCLTYTNSFYIGGDYEDEKMALGIPENATYSDYWPRIVAARAAIIADAILAEAGKPPLKLREKRIFTRE